MKSNTHVLLWAGARHLMNSCIKNELPHRKRFPITSRSNTNNYAYNYTYNSKWDLPAFPRLALWIIACSLLFSCHKPDFPGATKACQLIKTEGRQLSYDSRFIHSFSYNNKRQLDTLKWGPGFLPEPPIVVDIQYNAQLQPVLVKSLLATTKLIYQNGRISRVEELGTDNLFHLKFTLKYDFHGRIIEYVYGNYSVRYEYKDRSRNFSRRISGGLGPSEDWQFMEEYQYDHKVNPRATWPNLPLNPFSMEIYEPMPSSFEPISDNNCTYQASFGRSFGLPFMYQELFHSYEYDNVYPVMDHIRQVNHSPADPDRVTLTEIKYSYACKDNTNGHIQ